MVKKEDGKMTSNSHRWLVLVGALVVQLILGTVYGYSIFWQPLNTEIFPEVVTEAQVAGLTAQGADLTQFKVVEDEAAVKKQLAVQQGYLKYAFSICILTFAVVMVIAGRVQDVKGPRFPAMVGAVLLGAGFILAGLMRSEIVFYLAHAALCGGIALILMMLSHGLLGKTDSERSPIVQYIPLAIASAVIVAGVILGNQYVGKLGEFDKLFLLWGTIGFLAGAGIGFAYVCPIAALVKWFPKHKGLVSGIAVAGFGFGAYLFKGQTLGALGFIKEHDIVPFFIVHGIICFVAVTIGALMLRNPPGTATAPSTAGDSSWQDTLKRPAFYLLWLMFFSGAMAGLMVIGIVKPFVQDRVLSGGVSVEEAAAAGAAAVGYLAIFNALGRVAWGFTSDRIGRTSAFVLMFIIQSATMFMLGRLTSAGTLAIAAAVVGFNFGGNFALFPSATADLFGAKNLGANYGWVFTSYGIAGVVGVAAGNAAKVLTGSYSAAFTLAAVLCAVAACLGVVVGRLSHKTAVTAA
ncbi:MAG: OFA family MFS transporter [Verrucomicrobia bacterium]|nr:OFA family MFS transporter [Verrucomicrobiota bacterium]